MREYAPCTYTCENPGKYDYLDELLVLHKEIQDGRAIE